MHLLVRIDHEITVSFRTVPHGVVGDRRFPICADISISMQHQEQVTALSAPGERLRVPAQDMHLLVRIDHEITVSVRMIPHGVYDARRFAFGASCVIPVNMLHPHRVPFACATGVRLNVCHEPELRPHIPSANELYDDFRRMPGGVRVAARTRQECARLSWCRKAP